MHAIRRLLCAAALAVVADGAAATSTDLTFNGFAAGKRIVNVDARVAGATEAFRAYAGTFSVTGTDPVDTFVAWCIDIATTLHAKGTSRTYLKQDVLDAGQKADLQKLFDHAYVEADVLSSEVNTAAFQVAIWDAIYEDDWDAGAVVAGAKTDPTLPDYFRIIDQNAQSFAAVRDQANAYLALARDMSNPTPASYKLLQFDGQGATQSLVTVSSMPLPGGVLLLASGFGAAALVRRRRRSAEAPARA
jgi:hypothetical protein